MLITGLDEPIKIGLFGGSFDPVHFGHLVAARAAVEELGLGKLFFIPATQSPFKMESQLAPAESRLQWLRLALAGWTDCEVDDREIRRGGVSYAIDTVREYAKMFPQARLFYLIGGDNIAQLNGWREAEKLAKLAQFCAIPRPGWPAPEFPSPIRGCTLKGFPSGISSSEIRARVKAGLPIEHLVPPAVADAIRAAGLYT